MRKPRSPLVRNSKESAISKDDFHRQLRDFLASGNERVGDTEFGQTAWTWVKALGNRYYLNADSTRAGAEAYLKLITDFGEDLKWSVVENERGRENKVAFGHERAVIEGFYFYRAD